MPSVRNKKPLPADELAMIRTIGSNVRSVRETMGMSQAKLSRIIGITAQSIQNIEHGRHQIGVTTLHKIAETLGTHIQILIYGGTR